MEAERYERVRELFESAIDKSATARESYLARACAGDSELHERLQRLLVAVDESGHLTPDVMNSLLWEVHATLDGMDAGVTQEGRLFGAPVRGPEPVEFSPHQMLGRYCVVGRIATGGMGEVWRAVDTSLDREVAIKLLPRHWTRTSMHWERLRAEAKVVASLSHPNIVIIHAVEEIEDVPFIVMEMIGGRSLRECIPQHGMPFSQLLDYSIPLADALAVAHANGVTHRDLKPENIMVTDEGRIKVLDFGLAKRSSTESANDPLDARDPLASRGLVAGTPPYMSPEQLQARPTGPRSDVFSLGTLLHEMAVGERPFTGATMLDVVVAILSEPAPRPSSRRADLPAEFDDIVAGCLRKDPSERPPTASPVLARLKELRRERERAALRNLARSGRSGSHTSEATVMSAARVEVPQTIAVIPFEDLSAARDQDYLCAGIAGDIATQLSRIEGLRVTAVSRMDRQTMEPLEMGRMLRVGAFLDGSVARRDEQVRVTVRLVNVSDGAQLWSARFDRSVEDTFRIQDEVAEAVSNAFQMRIASPERERRVQSPAAYAAYLKGRFFWGKRYQGGLRRALECFGEAIELDREMPAAHVGLADCFVVLAHYGVLDPNTAYTQARESAQRALGLAPTGAEAHATMGWIAAFYDYDWESAAEWFRRALDLDPDYATAWEWNGIHLLSRRRPEEAVASLRQAQRADPLSLMISSILGWALHTAGEHEEAGRVLHNVLEMDPRFVFAHTILAKMQATNGDFDECTKTAENGAMLSGREGLSLAILAYAYGRVGRIDAADQVIEEIQARGPNQYVSPLHVALGHLGAGRYDETFAHLDGAIKARDSFFSTLYFDPAFDPVRDDERFRALVRAMNLDEPPRD